MAPGEKTTGGKTDMERIGLFQEMEYVTIGDKYKMAGKKEFNTAAYKGKQMLPGGSKTRTAGQGGYFSEKFTRVMESEAYSDPVKMRRQYKLKESKKNLGKAFLPSSGTKMQSGLGNHYGTLGGAVGAFSPVKKAGKPYKTDGRNFTTNPGKIGTGYGYPTLTIGKGYTYSSNPYNKGKELRRKELEAHKSQTKGGAFKLGMHPKSMFDHNPYATDKPLPPIKKTGTPKRDVKPFRPSHPAKAIGGSKAGTFDPYPSHSNDPYKPKRKKGPPPMNSTGKIFMPSPGPKTATTTSIIGQNVVKSINSTNYRQVVTSM
ncbi:cilia-and flagella-associated protein 96-like [Asterias amurensis]|uniref:cilia-and flagella-associated protein 96-like n=1 Tax=Asterias amurensis TaxID=7602 RepID=UPI003AB665B1